MLSVFSYLVPDAARTLPIPPAAMTTLPTLHALLIDELKDLYHAETQWLKVLPRMAKAAANFNLKAGFTGHLAQTRRHVERLAQAFKILGVPPKGKSCLSMIGLVEEGAEAIAIKGPPAVRDAALIGAAQRVEHYEIAGYGTARAFARAMGETRVAYLLQATLEEEGETNQELTQISIVVNADARFADRQILPTAQRRR